MKLIGAGDMETDPFKQGRFPVPFTVGFFDGKIYRDWWGPNCVRDFVAHLKKSRWEGYIYFHNGGRFDFHFLLPYLPRDVEIQAVKSRIAKIKAWGVEFRDSFLLLPVGLAHYAKEKFDYRWLEADVRESHKPAIRAYQKSDVFNLHAMVTDFIEEYGLGLTLAGRTFHILKHEFNLDPPKLSERHDTKFREFYYGGRVQFFKLGRLPGPWVLLDINSAYPRAMMEEHWFGASYEVRDSLPRSKKKLGQSFVDFTGEGGGALPVRGLDGAVLFPLGVHRFQVTGWEFLAARETGHLKVHQVHLVYVPQHCENFRAYVEKFYRGKAAAKAKGDKAGELFNKLILNSLYGRFALNPREFKDVILMPYGKFPPQKEGWSIARDFENAGLTLWERKTKVRHNSFFNVCTAASITGWVRAYLWRSLCAVKEPVYCDTDSIICRHPRKLRIGKNLGEWKKEGRARRVHIAGKKLYAAELTDGTWKCAAKGVKLSPRQICAVARGEVRTMTFDAPSYSLFGADSFTTRRVRRDDQRKRRNVA